MPVLSIREHAAKLAKEKRQAMERGDITGMERSMIYSFCQALKVTIHDRFHIRSIIEMHIIDFLVRAWEFRTQATTVDDLWTIYLYRFGGIDKTLKP